jgi:hypothetical protein
MFRARQAPEGFVARTVSGMAAALAEKSVRPEEQLAHVPPVSCAATCMLLGTRKLCS